MELQKYVQEAIVTESQKEEIITDPVKLAQAMSAFIAVGNLLDMIKKNVFYGKPIDRVKWANNAYRLHGEAHALAMTDHEAALGKATINVNTRLFHAIFGIATEATELVEALYDGIEDQAELDFVNLQEEIGDLSWYEAIAIDEMGASWDTILETNIKKLRARNKGKSFNAEATINRDVVAERKILEGEDNETVPGYAGDPGEVNFGGSDYL